MKTEINLPDRLGTVQGPYCHGIKAGEFIFSTQIGNVAGGALASSDVYGQTVQIMKNIGYILEDAGVDYEDIVKCSVYITDMNDCEGVNRAYTEFMKKPYPARACVQVAGLSPGAKVEMEFTIYIGK